MNSRQSSAVLWVIPAVYFVFVASEFALMTHMALQTAAQGRPVVVVGSLATAMWVGIVLASTRAHAVVARYGHARVFVAATALACAAIAGTTWHEHIAGWLASAFVLGLGGGFVWVAGESWLAEAAPAEKRGLYVGLFETAVGLGLMVGPAMVPLLRWLDVPVPLASTALMLLALLVSLPLLAFTAPARPAVQAGTSADTAADAAAWRTLMFPLLAVAVLSGLMEAGVSALLPAISMRLGMTLESAAWLGAVIGAGSALLQPPAGHLADRFGVRHITLAAWLVVLVANAVLLMAASNPLQVLWFVGFTLGGVGGAVYTLMIVELGNRLSGARLVRAIGWLVVAYSVGTASSPALGGALFDATGLHGLASALLFLSAAGLAVTYLALTPGTPLQGRKPPVRVS